MPDPRREAREIALASLALLVALEALRAIAPHVDPVYRAFALRRSFSNAPSILENVLYAVGFAIVILAPLAGPVSARYAKGPRALLGIALAAAVARALVSLAPTGLLSFWASVATLAALLGALLPVLLDRARRLGVAHVPATALLVALAVDLALRAGGGTYDATLLPGWPWAGIAVAALLAATAIRAPPLPPPDDPSPGRLRGVARGLLLGASLALGAMLLLSPAALARWTGAPLAAATAGAILAVAAAAVVARRLLPRRFALPLALAPLAAALALLLPGPLALAKLALALLGAVAVASAAARALADETRARGGYAPLFWIAAVGALLAAHAAYVAPFARAPRWREFGEHAHVGMLAIAGLAFLATERGLARFGARREPIWGPRWVPTLATAAVALLLAVPTALPPRAADAPDAAFPLRFVTFNVHQGVDLQAQQDWAAMGDVLAALDPDVVALQEIETGRAARLGADGLAILARRLGMEESLGATIGREYGDAILSRFPIVERETILLPSGGEQRGAARARIDLGNGMLVDVYSTHLGFGNSERYEQASVLADRVVDAAVPAIVAGDFNDFGGSATLPFRSAGMILSQEIVPSPPYTFTTRTPRVSIDYVFATDDFTFLAHRVDATCASDHFAVLAVLADARAPVAPPALPPQADILACE